MERRIPSRILPVLFAAILIVQACGTNVLTVTEVSILSTSTVEPAKSTGTAIPSLTAIPTFTKAKFGLVMPTRTPNLTATFNAQQHENLQGGAPGTPRPTRTPNLAETQKSEEWDAEVESYFDAGYLKTIDGKFLRFKDFDHTRAELGWYRRWRLNITAKDFYMSAHLKWSSAYRSADISGCGFVFAEQENGDEYAVFLDRSKVLFVRTEDGYFREIGSTRGTGRVKFGNPFDEPVEADLTVIVQDAYAYVLVDGDVVGEYTLSQSRALDGEIGLALLSGTNKDFGTRCEMTNIHAWLPEE